MNNYSSAFLFELILPSGSTRVVDVLADLGCHTVFVYEVNKLLRAIC